MKIKETPQLGIIIRDLWNDFFPSKNTASEDVARCVANRDWLRDSLMFYGWPIGQDDKISVDLSYVDGGGVLYYGPSPCALISINWTGLEPQLRFTYVDNRTQ